MEGADAPSGRVGVVPPTKQRRPAHKSKCRSCRAPRRIFSVRSSFARARANGHCATKAGAPAEGIGKHRGIVRPEHQRRTREIAQVGVDDGAAHRDGGRVLRVAFALDPGGGDVEELHVRARIVAGAEGPPLRAGFFEIKRIRMIRLDSRDARAAAAGVRRHHPQGHGGALGFPVRSQRRSLSLGRALPPVPRSIPLKRTSTTEQENRGSRRGARSGPSRPAGIGQQRVDFPKGRADGRDHRRAAGAIPRPDRPLPRDGRAGGARSGKTHRRRPPHRFFGGDECAGGGDLLAGLPGNLWPDRPGTRLGAPNRPQFDAQCSPDGALLVGGGEGVAEKVVSAHRLLGGLARLTVLLDNSALTHRQIMRTIELLGPRVAPLVNRELAAGRGV